MVVGDIHGCLTEYRALLKKAGWGSGDGLVLVGDLVAKGPDSAGVVALSRELGARAVLGNHDARLVEGRAQDSKRGEHSKQTRALSSADLAYLAALPLTLELPEFRSVVVHGGLLPGVPLREQPRRWCLTLRSLGPDGTPSSSGLVGTPWASKWTGPEFAIFGHDALRGLQRTPHALGLDTGCVYGGKLTSVWLPDLTLVQVDAIAQWSHGGHA